MRSRLFLLSVSFVACVAAVPPVVPAAAPNAVPKLAPSAELRAWAPDLGELAARQKALAETRNCRAGLVQQPTLSADGKYVYFLRSRERNVVQRLLEFSLERGTERELIAPEALLASEVLTPEERARRERLRISAKGFTSFELADSGNRMLLPLGAKAFLLELGSGEVAPIPLPAGAFDPHLSHDGKKLGFVLAHNVYVMDLPELSLLAKQKPRAVTKTGTEERPFGTADFLAQEEFDRTRGWFFSPDDSEMLVQTTDNRGVERLSIMDPASPEQAPERPFYPRVGKANPKVGFARINLRTLALQTLAVPEGRYVADVLWRAQGRSPCLLELSRDQKLSEVVCYGAGPSREIARQETDAAWVSGAHLVATEDGTAGLAVQDDHQIVGYSIPGAAPGERPAQAQSAETVLRALGGRVDGAVVTVTKDGLHVGLAGLGSFSALGTLSPARGSIEPKLLLKQGKVLSYETQEDADPVWRVRALSAGFPILATLRNEIEPHALPAVSFMTLGPKRIHAAVVYPMRAGKRVPNAELQPAILDAAYGGPHVNTVQPSAHAYLRAQWMADATGAIVVTLDGRGTPRRGRDWERAIYKNFDVILQDHVEAVTALAQIEFPGKVVQRGIYGWSFGGYLSAYAALKAPQTFAAAFVGAPPADWRDYDSAYTERYLGFPVEESVYDAYSLPALAQRVPRASPMLLVHGMADDNVFFLNSLKLSAALSRAGHSVEFWPLPKTTHMLVDPGLTQDVYMHAATFLRSALRGHD